MANFEQTITITFGDVAENHVGNQQINNNANIDKGFSKEQMETFVKLFNDKYGTNGTIHILNNHKDQEYASLIHIPNAIEKMEINPDDLFKEQTNFTWDSKYYDTRRSKVLNKNARHNICYNNESQEPDYENKKGTIKSWKSVPLLDKVRTNMIDILGHKYSDIVAEGNLYYKPNKCGIGFHGDTERHIVVAIRLGETIPLVYQWYKNGVKYRDSIKFLNIKHGDLYIMSEKAVGRDWKKRGIFTLRHAAGCKKYTGV